MCRLRCLIFLVLPLICLSVATAGTNLLNNAGQVSPREASIQLRGRLHATYYEVEVVDQGPGVSPDDKPHIFEPFFSKRKGGSGLGLAVCQGIVRAHGGSIEVEDAPGSGGSGAVFRVRLSLKQSERGSGLGEPFLEDQR